MENNVEFNALAERYALSNQSIGLMIDRNPVTVCRYRSGSMEIPPAILSTLRRIVAAIDAAK